MSIKNLQKGKQVWLYLNRRTMWRGYMGTIIFSMVKKNPFLNHMYSQTKLIEIHCYFSQFTELTMNSPEGILAGKIII